MTNVDWLNDEAQKTGGTWINLKNKGDKIKGELISVDRREKRFEGEVVRNRKTGEPRVEWIVTLRVDDLDPARGGDDGIRKVTANESMQRALKSAAKTQAFEVGGTLTIGCVEDPPDSRSQAEYAAKFAPPARKVNILDDDEDLV